MPFNIVKTPSIESILDTTSHPKASTAIEELRKLRDVNRHLLAHFVAVQHQTDTSASILRSFIGEAEPHTAAALILPDKKE